MLDRIRNTATAFKQNKIYICDSCEATIKKFKLYTWDEKSTDTDRRIKEYDHAMNDIMYSVQTAGELKNISKYLGFAVKQPSGKLKFLPAAEYYQSTLDNAVTGIASGAFDYNTVIKKTVAEMTNSGLRTVDYATGRSNRVDVAARIIRNMRHYSDKESFKPQCVHNYSRLSCLK